MHKFKRARVHDLCQSEAGRSTRLSEVFCSVKGKERRNLRTVSLQRRETLAGVGT